MVWTRHPDACVPEEQTHLCYFRPGTGLSIWLTSADLQNYPKRRRKNVGCGPHRYGDDEVLELNVTTPSAECKEFAENSSSLDWSLVN